MWLVSFYPPYWYQQTPPVATREVQEEACTEKGVELRSGSMRKYLRNLEIIQTKISAKLLGVIRNI